MGPDQAAFLGGPVLVAVEATGLASHGGQYRGVLCPGRKAAIGGIDDQRRASAGQAFGVQRPQPHRVVVVGRIRLHGGPVSRLGVIVERIGERAAA